MGHRIAAAASAHRRLIRGRRLAAADHLTDEAVAHLEAIVDYVEAFDSSAARRLGARLVEVAESLAEFPERGRDAGLGRREMTIAWPYILRYRVEDERIVILRIRHGARDEEPS